MIGCKIKPIPNTDIVYLHKVSPINKHIDCLYVMTSIFRGTHAVYIAPYSDRVFASAKAVIQPLESRIRGQKGAH